MVATEAEGFAVIKVQREVEIIAIINVREDLKGLMETQEEMAKEEREDHKECPASVAKALLDTKVPKVAMGLMDVEVRAARKAILGLKVPLPPMEHRVYKVRRANREMWVSLEVKDRKALMDRRANLVPKDNLAHKVKSVQMVTMVSMDHKDPKVWLEKAEPKEQQVSAEAMECKGLPAHKALQAPY